MAAKETKIKKSFKNTSKSGEKKLPNNKRGGIHPLTEYIL